MRYLLILAVAVLVPAAAQAQQPKEPGPLKLVELSRKDEVSYEKEIEPIFAKKCISCHSGERPKSRFSMESYEGLVKGGAGGTAIMPGKGHKSLLYQVLTRTDTEPFMPPAGEPQMITPEEAALIKLWIDQGAKAPANTGPRARPKIVVSLPPANVTPVRAVAISPDKTAIAASRGNQIHLYDAGSGKHVRTLVSPGLKTPDAKDVQAAHLSLVESMAWSPDGKYLVSGSFQEVIVWDPLTGQQRHKLTGFSHDVVALAFSLDSKLLGVTGGEPTVEGEVKVFEVGTWKLLTDIKDGHSDTVYGLAFSPDNKMLATGAADKFVKVWSLPEGKLVKSFEGHTHHVLDVGWMGDGKLLASAGGDNTVKVWDFDKGEQVRTIKAHEKQVTRLVFIGKKAEFITSGGDNQVKAFNATNGGNVRNFAGSKDFIYAIGVSEDGTLVAAGGEEGIVRVYNGTNAQLVQSLLPPGVEPPGEPQKK